MWMLMRSGVSLWIPRLPLMNVVMLFCTSLGWHSVLIRQLSNASFVLKVWLVFFSIQTNLILGLWYLNLICCISSPHSTKAFNSVELSHQKIARLSLVNTAAFISICPDSAERIYFSKNIITSIFFPVFPVY